MPNGRKVSGAIAASILLAASLVSTSAMAAKPPPPPPPVEDPDDPWYGCSPWGPYIYGVDCCDYPELIIPCQGPNPPLDPVIIPLDAKSEAAAG